MAIKGNMTNNKAYMDNLLLIAFSLILNPFSSGTYVGENNISIEYDENAPKQKKTSTSVIESIFVKRLIFYC
jgi:hypothetical protein